MKASTVALTVWMLQSKMQPLDVAVSYSKRPHNIQLTLNLNVLIGPMSTLKCLNVFFLMC